MSLKQIYVMIGRRLISARKLMPTRYRLRIIHADCEDITDGKSIGETGLDSLSDYTRGYCGEDMGCF